MTGKLFFMSKDSGDKRSDSGKSEGQIAGEGTDRFLRGA